MCECLEGMELPTRQNEEFRPFIRRLPEFKFWYSATKATVIAFCCTFFELFNVPVFWPILVMYFITLFCITMKRQIKVGTKNNNMEFKIYLMRIAKQKYTQNLNETIYLPKFLFQHMIRYRYIPFTWGKPKFQVESR